MAHDTEVVNPRAKITKGLLSVYGVCIYIFLFAPIAVMIALSFNKSNVVGFPMTGFTLDWYQALTQNATIQGALANTLWVASWVVILATVIGTAAAFPLVRAQIKYPAAVRVFVTLPIMIPGLLIGVAILVLSTNILHLQPSLPIAVIGQTVLATPFVILVVSSRLETLDRNYERAAADLGAGPVKRFVFVIMPLIYPGVVAAALMAFTLSLDEFVVTNFIIGSDQTLPIYIYSQLKFGITPEVNALATLMLLATVTLIGVTALALKLIKMLTGRKVRKAQLEEQNA
ncbi:ABC transporter permease [Diaminobutyricibacter sp. McL0618]|uniref:ABC transporter permease n=1 Tax=Leifsonia sp. McL0618 TaxID=3415677 RepID=UPI003CE7020B